MADPRCGGPLPVAARPPCAAYLHVPFCRHRCGYCNFTLVAGRNDLAADYLRALEIELRSLQSPCEVDTLYIGGGTPTHLGESDAERLLGLLRHWLPLAGGGEWSFEANPSDVDLATVQQWSQAGENRISLGVQSFDADKLTVLERDHQRSTIERAAGLARDHLAAVAMDLIFGVPGESAVIWRNDLDAALKLAPDHLSCYGLTIERGTAFFARHLRGDLLAVDETVEAKMYETAVDRLTQAGWEHYEVSSFARPGYRCRHNETYWSGRSYLAFGPGAARYVNGRRETNHRSTTTYLKRMLSGQSPVADCEQLPPAEAAREYLVFGLRRLQGIDREQFQADTGFDLDQLVGPTLRRLVQARLLVDHPRVQLTRRGLLVSDSIWPELL